MKNGNHVHVAYLMKPNTGFDYLATASQFTDESSTGTSANACTTDDFAESADALVYFIDHEGNVRTRLSSSDL